MIHEKSCGAVIYFGSGNNRVFLVEQMRKGHISLCKGHVEAGENEHQTAAREIREETGLTVRFIDGFRHTVEYSPCGGTLKQVVFFLAESDSNQTVPQPEEVVRIRWLPLPEAISAMTYESDRETLRLAAGFLAER